MWWSEWDSLGPELERINMASPIMEREQCQRCRSLQADNEAMERQSQIAVKAYEETIEAQRQVIQGLREQVAALQLNADMQITRDIGWDTTGLSS